MSNNNVNAERLTIAGAIEAIRKVIPREEGLLAGRTVSIEVTVSDRSGVDWHGNWRPREVEIRAWDGENHYEGATLETAVNALVYAHTNEPNGTLEEAERLLAEVEQ